MEGGAEADGVSNNRVTALYLVAEHGHNSVVHLLLERGANIEAKDGFRRTVFFSATLKGHILTLKLLLEVGANVNAKNADNRTVLLYLASERPEKLRNAPEMIQLLLSTSIDLEAKDKIERTALHWAADTGKKDFARLL